MKTKFNQTINFFKYLVRLHFLYYSFLEIQINFFPYLRNFSEKKKKKVISDICVNIVEYSLSTFQ